MKNAIDSELVDAVFSEKDAFRLAVRVGFWGAPPIGSSSPRRWGRIRTSVG